MSFFYFKWESGQINKPRQNWVPLQHNLHTIVIARQPQKKRSMENERGWPESLTAHVHMALNLEGGSLKTKKTFFFISRGFSTEAELQNTQNSKKDHGEICEQTYTLHS